MIKWDLNIWNDELTMKQAYIYTNKFGEETIYDNMLTIDIWIYSYWKNKWHTSGFIHTIKHQNTCNTDRKMK